MQLDEAKYQKQLREQLTPYVLRQAGMKMDEAGNIVPMSEQERLAGMTEEERMQYDLSKLASQRSMQALKGELPLSQAVEQEIAKQGQQLNDYMSRKLGPNWRQTTPGVQALAEFNAKANALREEQQYGRLGALEGINQAQAGLLGGMRGASAGYATSPFAWSQGLMSGAGAAQQPWMFDRQMQMQAQLANQQSKSGMMAGLGSLLGTGLMAGASYFGGPAAAAGILASRGLMGSGPYAYGGYGP